MIEFVSDLLIWFLSAVCVTGLARRLVHSLPVFEDRFVLQILGQLVAYPNSSSCSTLKNGKALKVIELKSRTNFEVAERDVLKPITKDPNLLIAGVTDDLVKALRGFFLAGNTFVLDGMDAIILSNNNVDLLTIRYPPAGYDRSVHLDISNYKSLYWAFDAVLTTALFLIAVYMSRDGVTGLVLTVLLALGNVLTSSKSNVGEKLKCAFGL